MRRIFLSILSGILFVSSAYSQSEILNKAYKKRSKELLGEFFTSWQNQTQPISDNELGLLSDTILNAYKCFGSFYLPMELEKIGIPEWGTDMNEDASCIIVQNKLKINIVDSLKFERTENNPEEEILFSVGEGYYDADDITYSEVINDFRPVIKDYGRKILYLNDIYSDTLNSFLGRKLVDNRYVYGISYKQVRKRENFLKSSIRVWPGHWNSDWHLITQPEVFSITFDSKMENAIVFFRVVYQGGTAILKKENDEWTLVSSWLTWIE
ncbi:hypothetical protein [uncultured Alistipes sp.]|jgi:hypothetical protein|uniref:hypothetical protein n=1 Tax=uncultured Alistipes sp. TaxID=538949 RepID=UPI0025DE59DA|nr:hypothetical protein [uncultured Alistipes sp.]